MGDATLVQQGNNMAAYMATFVVDKVDDIKSISKTDYPAGTQCFVIDGCATWMLGHDNQWHPINLGGGSSGGGGGGGTGENGATFTPSVSAEGVISWTNDKSLINPDPVNIKGPKGDAGAVGPAGPAGKDGATFTPAVSEEGVLSWTNDKNLQNPDEVNIKGATFTPTIGDDGKLIWTNDKQLPNPTATNLVPHIDSDSLNWFIGDKDTGVNAAGKKQLTFANRQDFPSTGEETTLYIAKDEKKIYFYDKASAKYVEIGRQQVDTAMSNVSENPVQNKVIYKALENMQEAFEQAIKDAEVEHFKIVEYLPVTEISKNTIYLVPKAASEGQQNIYDEYIFINDKWEYLGTGAIDLSDYYNKDDIDDMFLNLEEPTEIVGASEDGSAFTNKGSGQIIWTDGSQGTLWTWTSAGITRGDANVMSKAGSPFTIAGEGLPTFSISSGKIAVGTAEDADGKQRPAFSFEVAADDMSEESPQSYTDAIIKMGDQMTMESRRDKNDEGMYNANLYYNDKRVLTENDIPIAKYTIESKPFSIDISAWKEITSDPDYQNVGYTYYAEITAPEITENQLVRLIFDADCIKEAASKVAPGGVTLDGKLVLFADVIPEKALTGVYYHFTEGGDTPTNWKQEFFDTNLILGVGIENFE